MTTSESVKSAIDRLKAASGNLLGAKVEMRIAAYEFACVVADHPDDQPFVYGDMEAAAPQSASPSAIYDLEFKKVNYNNIYISLQRMCVFLTPPIF
jgi:hypothetical protein